MKKEELKKPIYVAKVGTPLQKALVNNFEAQKQLEQVLDKYVQMTEERIVGIIEKQRPTIISGNEITYWKASANKFIDRILSLITNKSDINK